MPVYTIVEEDEKGNEGPFKLASFVTENREYILEDLDDTAANREYERLEYSLRKN